MDNKIRESGLDFIKDIPWGSHICHFYDSKNDLLEVLLPYFKAGLENNEYCIWITSDPLTTSEAHNALNKEVSRLAHCFQKGQIEILGYDQWYTKSGKFYTSEVLKGWVNKEKQALTKGFEGLRVTGNVSWLDKKDWPDFKEYENIVNHIIGDHQMQVICSYSLQQCDPKTIIDVVSTHQYSLIKGSGKWKLIESSERKKAEEALRASEEKFKALFENSPDGIVIIDVENCTIIDCNTAAHKNLGYSKEEFKKLHISDFDVCETPEQIKNYMQELLREGCSSFETKHRKKDGEIIDVFINSKKLTINGNLLVMSILRDITIKKKNEEEIRRLVDEQAQELLEAHQKLEVSRRLADIGTLAASVAHELRNPLSVIKASMYNIKRKRTNPEIDKNINSVNKKITESDQIISNLLFYSKIQDPFMLKTNLYDTLDESIDYVSRYMPESGLIKKTWSAHKELQIAHDSAQMGEVFSNILMNACQAFGEKGGIIQISLQEDDNYIHIHFKDNGPGIPKEHITKITEPFFTTKTKGIGLGLSVTAKIIQLHDGTLEFTSKRGVGTTVTVKLPKK